jgi:DNA N-6-adenine-methyltransferase (Dam)
MSLPASPIPNPFPPSKVFDYAKLGVEVGGAVRRKSQDIHALVKRSAQDIIAIGRILIEVQSLLGHGNRADSQGFQAWLKAEFDWDYRTAHRFMSVARTFKNDNLSDFAIAPSALYLLSAPSTPEEARQEALSRAARGEAMTYSQSRAMIHAYTQPADKEEARGDGNPAARAESLTPQPAQPRFLGIALSSESDEHYTPDRELAAVYACLGEIDLDPCSNSRTTPNVLAKAHLTRQEDGLRHPWHGKVFMNPPYSDVRAWMQKLCDEYADGRVIEAIALTKNDTSTGWFQMIWQGAAVVCFPDHRLKFKGNDTQAPQAHVFAYFGRNLERFYQTFHGTVGVCVRVMQDGSSREQAG